MLELLKVQMQLTSNIAVDLNVSQAHVLVPPERGEELLSRAGLHELV
jgi:hypothetical protein